MPRSSASVVWLWLACAALAAPARGAELPFRHFTTETEARSLPSASVQQIIQDRLGYIWMAFYSAGVVRYDGHTFETYTTADGIADLTAREIVEDRFGYLWVGSETGLVVSEKPLSEYAPGARVRFTRSVGGVRLIQKRIRRNWLTANHDGSLWAGTAGEGLFRYSRDARNRLVVRQLSTAAREGARNEPVSALAALRDGTVLVAAGTGNIVRYAASGRLIGRYDAAAGVPQKQITVISEGRRGRVWIGTVDGEIFKSEDLGHPFTRANDTLRSRVFSIIELRDHTVWAASLGSGVVRFPVREPSRATVIDRKSGLLSDSLWSILVDREENVWFAQNGGVSRLKRDHRAFDWLTATSHVGESPTLPDPSAFGVLAARSRSGNPILSHLWVGTGGGAVAVHNGAAVAAVRAADGLAGSSVYALGADDSRLWIGTVEGFAVLSRPGDEPPQGDAQTRQPIDVAGAPGVLTSWRLGGPVYACRAAPPDSRLKGSVWIAGATGVRALVGTHWFTFDGSSGLPPTGASNLAFDDESRLWVATTDGGLLRSREPVTPERLMAISHNGGEVRRIRSPFFEVVWSEATDAPTNSIRALEWNRGEMWVATARGLFAFSSALNRVVHRIESFKGHRVESVSSLALSRSGQSLWASTDRGLLEVDTTRGTIRRRVAKEDGLLANESWGYSAVEVGEDDVVYLANPNGVSIYRPDFDEENSVEPLLRLRRFEIREDADGTNEVALEFAALSFANEAAVRYKTRLVGYDRDWSPATSEYKIRYTNLPALFWPRSYELQVVAANEDGNWTTEPLRYGFSITPAWWLRWWAFIVYAALFVLCVLSFNRYRTRKLEQLNRALEVAIDSRTDQIWAQARELETFDRIVQVMNREVSLDKLLQTLLQQGLILFPQAEKAAFLVFDSEQERVEVAAVSGYDRELFRGVSFSLEEAIRRYCEGAELLGHGVYLIRDFSHLAGQEKIVHLPQPKSMLAMEVALGGLLEGFLIFDNFTERDAFDHSDLRRLSRFREHAVSAIAKARVLRELELKNREAEQANRAKSAFLANMSHELRTPLNSIIGFSEILVERLENEISARYMNFLRLILTSGQHLLTIINDILDLSKIEAGRMEVHPEHFYVRPVIEGVCTVMKGLSSKKGITFALDVSPDLPALDADAGKFKQILYNLLSNAVKFSPVNSTVTITARTTTGRSGVEMMSVSVRDEGIGIAAEHQRVIFDEFRQLDATSTRRYEGTGLGLSLVKKFVDIQGGNVEVSSELGKGSTFSFSLPLEAVAKLPLSGHSDLVLVVTEDDSSYAAAQRIVVDFSCTTIRAHDLGEGVRYLREMTVGAVLIEAELAEREIEAPESLRRAARTPELAVAPMIVAADGEVTIGTNGESMPLASFLQGLRRHGRDTRPRSEATA
jgi:signal transduction histidine kinase/ligand-binding sensor domain-containing protein